MGHKESWLKLLKFNCTGCGNCCRDTVVCITDDDVRRIVDGSGKQPRTFLRFFGPDEVRMAKRSPFWVRFGGRRAVMALRWERGHCVFLDADNRCMVYEHRPVTCRQHPFEVVLSESGGVKRLSLSRVTPCPHGWQGRLTRRGLRALLGWNDEQSDRYLAKVKEWNRGSAARQTRPAFLRFLGLGG